MLSCDLPHVLHMVLQSLCEILWIRRIVGASMMPRISPSSPSICSFVHHVKQTPHTMLVLLDTWLHFKRRKADHDCKFLLQHIIMVWDCLLMEGTQDWWRKGPSVGMGWCVSFNAVCL